MIMVELITKNPKEIFYDLVRTRFHGNLKPPFNTEARSAAGMTEDWYLPLALKENSL
jgi:uncharacterized ferritin-like protein (DUF455 family)